MGVIVGGNIEPSCTNSVVGYRTAYDRLTVVLRSPPENVLYWRLRRQSRKSCSLLGTYQDFYQTTPKPLIHATDAKRETFRSPVFWRTDAEMLHALAPRPSDFDLYSSFLLLCTM
jgi:hypothetical protein